MNYISSDNKAEILEIGNVLNHYFELKNHTVVDKYEKYSDVINCDAIDYQTNKRFDLIISISTFEHIGYNEIPQDKQKVLEIYLKLKSLLKDNGKLIVTIPIGYNDFITEYIREKRFDFHNEIFLKRINKSNKWLQVGAEDAIYLQYNSPYQNANSLYIGIYENKQQMR
jgi:cyclopropane fatty-acyl-phospholipid synthase-like methyltransferase